MIILGVCFGLILFHCFKHLFSGLNVNSESEPDWVDVVQDMSKLVSTFKQNLDASDKTADDGADADT